MVDERIIERIKKCLALAGNNPNEAEATAAALQAQKLMAKYNVELADIEDEIVKEEIKIASADVGTGMAWKFQLAGIIANNFKCRTFSYGTKIIAFYGHETDSLIAKEVFTFLLKRGHNLALSERAKVRKSTGSGDGVYNSFVLGFLAGVREKLEAQSTALLIVVPQEVKEGFDDFIKGAKSRSTKNLKDDNFNYSAYKNGQAEGRSAMGNRELESK